MLTEIFAALDEGVNKSGYPAHDDDWCLKLDLDVIQVKQGCANSMY